MSSTFLRDRAAESSTKLNKTPSGADTVLKSSISIKPKPLISCTTPAYRSTIGARNTQKKNQKEVQKLEFPLDKYLSVLFPVEYAQNGFVLELSNQSNDSICRIKMDYNQYDILANGIQHNFSMPIMEMSIKHIKVLLSDLSSSKFSIALHRSKGKIREDKVQTNTFLSTIYCKDLVEIDPFKEIEESQIRRKKMLMKEVPKLKMEKVYSKTEMDEIAQEEDLEPQLFQTKQQEAFKTPKAKNKADYFSISSNENTKLVKADIFKLLTPRVKGLDSPFDQQKKEQQENEVKTCKKTRVIFQEQPPSSPEVISPLKKKSFPNQKSKLGVANHEVCGNINNLSSASNNRQEVLCPRK